MIAPARAAAYDIGRAMASGSEDLPTAIARVRRTLHDERDRALASEIATGVQRWRAALDHVIVHVAKRPLARLDPEVVEVLRLGAYQLLHLTRVPAAAVVDDAVNLVGRAGKRSASGLVNAVLRTISRQRASLALPARPGDPGDREAAIEYLSTTLSHPRWLAARWHDRLGFDVAEQWMQFNNQAAPLTLRANRRVTTRDELAARLAAEDVETTPGRYAPDALLVASGHPLRTAAASPAWFLVQDEASQLVALLAGPAPGPLVLDLCAAPGGKTTALASATAPGLVVACDRRWRRIALLQRTLAAAGTENARVVQANGLEPLPFAATFDTVLVDAPCSGLGTLRRDPDIRWRRHEAELEAFADTQRRLLVNAAAVVRPGGRLIYATCSSEPEENDDVVERFLEATGDFAILDARTAHPGLPEEVVDGVGYLRTAPDRHGLEAFFGAVLVRNA